MDDDEEVASGRVDDAGSCDESIMNLFWRVVSCVDLRRMGCNVVE